MKTTKRHRRIAHAIWEAGGRLDEVAEREGVRPDTLRRWLAEPAFRALLAQDALEPLLQATSAVLRWTPVAVARLIRDLEGESASDARQAAREILRLATDAQRDLARPGESERQPEGDDGLPMPAEDPLGRRVARLTDEQMERIFAILNQADASP